MKKSVFLLIAILFVVLEVLAGARSGGPSGSRPSGGSKQSSGSRPSSSQRASGPKGSSVKNSSYGSSSTKSTQSRKVPGYKPKTSTTNKSIVTNRKSRLNSRNSSKVNAKSEKAVSSFNTGKQPKAISKYQGKSFTKVKVIKTSSFHKRPVSITYSRPIIFVNPYLFTNHPISKQDTVKKEDVFPGFGDGKSGGGGASISFADSLKKQSAKSELDLMDLIPVNYLSDYANVIPLADEKKINSAIKEYKKKTSVEIGILTIPTLGDEVDMEGYAQVIFDKWGIGTAGINNGILIVISTDDELLRLQPGYGLEGVLPDITCRHIENDVMVPYCEKEEWSKSLFEVTQTIAETLGYENVEIMKQNPPKDLEENEEEATADEILLLVVIFGIVVLLFFVFKSRM